jgi:hypothetical protein
MLSALQYGQVGRRSALSRFTHLYRKKAYNQRNLCYRLLWHSSKSISAQAQWLASYRR